MELCHMALMGCGVAITGMAAYIVTLIKKIGALYDAQILRLERQLELVKPEVSEQGGS